MVDAGDLYATVKHLNSVDRAAMAHRMICDPETVGKLVFIA